MNDVNRRASVVLGVVLLIMGSGVAAAATIGAGSGVGYETPSGLFVTIDSQHSVTSTNPFVGETAVEIDDGGTTRYVGLDRNITSTDGTLSIGGGTPRYQLTETSDTQSLNVDHFPSPVTFADDFTGDDTDELVYGDGLLNLAVYDYNDGGHQTLSPEKTRDIFFNGDTDGDGINEIVWYDFDNEQSNVYDFVDKTDDPISTVGGEIVAVGDTDGDAVAEVLTKDSSTGEIIINDIQDSTTLRLSPTGVNATTGDIDTDGTDEVVYNDNSGDVVVFNDGSTTTRSESQPVEGLADIDGDDSDELIFENGPVLLDFETGETVSTPDEMDASYEYVYGDVNGDGVNEIVSGNTTFNALTKTNKTYDFTGRSAVGDIEGDGIAEFGYEDPSNGELNIFDPTPATRIAKDSGADVTISGQITTAEFASAPAFDNDEDDLIIDGAWSGEERITIDGFTAGQRWAAFDGTNLLDSGRVTDAGRVELDVSAPSSEQTIRLRTTNAPTISEATASPQGGDLSDNAFSFEPSIAVDDPDFDRDLGGAFGDNLTVRWYTNGELRDTTSTTESGTVTNNITLNTIGEQTWSVEVEDAYGSTVESKQFEFSTRADLTIRKVSNTSKLVNNATVDLTFFGDEEVVTRSTETGIIDFSGLPADERFEVVAEAEGYKTRTTIIPSIKSQQEIYLLANDTATVEPRFTIESAVSEFSETQSEITISRPLKSNGTTKYVRVEGGTPGTNGLNTVLEENQQYRISVRAPSGATRQLGGYRATNTEAVELQIEGKQFDASQSVQGTTFSSVFVDGSIVTEIAGQDVESATVSIARQDNGSQIFSERSAGNLSVSTPVDNSTQYNVTMTAQLTNGEEITQTRRVASSRIPTGGAIDNQWQQLISMAALLVIGGLFTRANAGVGAITTASVGGLFWYVGWLNGLATGLSVVVALLIGVLAYAKQRGQGVPT